MADGRIHRLNLRAESDSLIRRAVFLVEDAMRTASLPDTGRWLIFRSLSLGTIRADLPPSSLSMQIERRFRELSSQAVYALEPSAKDAPCVFFWDDAEPYAALTLYLCKGGRADAWFWPLAVSGFQPGMSQQEALRTAVLGAMASPARAGALFRILLELHQAGKLDILLESLLPADGPVLLHTLWADQSSAFSGFSAAETRLFETGVPIPASDSIRELQSPALLGTLQRWLEIWGVQDMRAPWLAAALLCTERPTRLFDRRLPAQVRALLGALQPAHSPAFSAESIDSPHANAPVSAASQRIPEQGASSMPKPASSPAPPLQNARTSGPLAQAEAQLPQVLAFETPPTLDAGSAPPPSIQIAENARAKGLDFPFTHTPPHLAAELPRQPEVQAKARPQASRLDAFPFSEKSQAAGLFFLIPIFEHLGISLLLQSESQLFDGEFVSHLFLGTARRLGIPKEDPILQLFKLDNPLSFPPSLHRIASYPPLLGIAHPQAALTFEELLGIFHKSARRFCRLQVGMGLRRLVMRNARVQSSPTHIDLFFDHRQADILIRKAGLDIDPGWVPWLGRVIHYHYLHGEL